MHKRGIEFFPRRDELSGPGAGDVVEDGRLGAVAVAGIAAASIVPPDAWAMLLGLGLLLMMLLFTVAPIAIPVLAFVWIARVLAGPSRRQLRRGYGGWSDERRPARWM